MCMRGATKHENSLKGDRKGRPYSQMIICRGRPMGLPFSCSKFATRNSQLESILRVNGVDCRESTPH